ncbi:MAG: DUF1446 domain-containing protein [Pseudomonadota bacterium]|nr:DUF1446 domain-containing protein [Pseudomonadota bacterium]
MPKPKKIRIANASGFWGDDPEALQRQVEGGAVDYISMDFLAEVTMSIMQKQRRRNHQLGYATDFLTMLKPVLGQIVRDNICVITNAGGVNPVACAQAIAALAAEQQVALRIAIVDGDEILAQIKDLRAQGISFDNMEDGTDFADVQERVEAANVYFGAQAVVAALKLQPHIVITGRVTDTGITLAPMMHAFGWRYDEWNKLASGIVAGHLLECGSQVTGGNFTDWRVVDSFTPMGFPIAEVSSDGTFVITKHPNTGGAITVDTVREQLFYEMGDPSDYITPDVVCDFTQLRLRQAGEHRVAVSGVVGRPATADYKVSICYRDGFKATGALVICGDDAVIKAKKFAEIFWQRCRYSFAETLTEYLGWNACHGSLASGVHSDEVMLRLSVRDSDRELVRKFAKLVPAMILSGPPGVTIVGGAPRVQEIVSYWPALMPKTAMQPRLRVWGEEQVQTVDYVHLDLKSSSPSSFDQVATVDDVWQERAGEKLGTDSRCVALQTLCLARSGDKGDAANIGVLARNAEVYQYLHEHLTASWVRYLFRDFCRGEVRRYALPNLLGFNFILTKVLGGGGTKSLRIDAQGKTLAQALLRQKLSVPSFLCEEL